MGGCQGKKCLHVDQVSGRRILICEPGKSARLDSFSFPRAHAGIIENLAVSERMESLPFHCVYKASYCRKAVAPCLRLRIVTHREEGLFLWPQISSFIKNLSDSDFLNPMPISITAILTTFLFKLLKWYFWIPTNPLFSLCSMMF